MTRNDALETILAEAKKLDSELATSTSREVLQLLVLTLSVLLDEENPNG